MKINIDLDCVLNNLGDVWYQVLNQKYNLNIKQSDINQWDMSKTFTTLTKQQIFEPLLDESLWRNLKPIKDSQKYLELLNQQHNIKIITASHYSTILTKVEWIYYYYPYIKWKQFIITEDKQDVACDICVDDGLHNLIGGNYYKLLLDYSWNQTEKESDIRNNIIRCYNWHDIYNKILNIGQMKQIIERR